MKLFKFFSSGNEESNKNDFNSTSRNTEVDLSDELSNTLVRKRLLNNFLKEARIILREIDSNANTKKLQIFTFIKQVTDLMTLDGAIQSFNRADLEPFTVVQQVFEVRNNSYAESMLKRIILTADADLYPEEYVSNLQIRLSLARDPIILSPWNFERITQNIISGIGNEENPFSIDRTVTNVRNAYYYPVGIALCKQGNHSQYVSQLKGTGITNVDEIIDIRELYSFVNFDGDKFYYDFGDLATEPVSLSVKSRQEYFAGVLFEIGRVLKDYPSVFPINLRKIIDNQYKEK